MAPAAEPALRRRSAPPPPQSPPSKAEESARRDEKSRFLPLLCFDDLPEYLKDNEFILKYYRSEWPLKDAFFSIFLFHNETLNIWTHLIGFGVFLALTVLNLFPVTLEGSSLAPFSESFLLAKTKTNFSSQVELTAWQMVIPEGIKESSGSTVRWPFFVYLGGAMFCLLSCCVCHLLYCHSHRLNIFLLRMDYIGITVMIATSFFPPIFYIFQCQQLWQVTYLCGIGGIGILTVVTLLSPEMCSGKYRRVRALLFTAMGMSAIVPAAHALVSNWNNPRCHSTLALELAMVVSYFSGTFFYVCRIPERWLPGAFDFLGHSHQIFHLFVLLGALAHYAATLVFFDWHSLSPCFT